MSTFTFLYSKIQVPFSSSMTSIKSSTSELSFSATSTSSSSSYIIYRNYKYYGFVKRVFHYSLLLARYYINEPIFRKLNTIQNYLLELFGLICVLLLIPILCCNAFFLYISRISRIYLIRRFYPELRICDDFSLRSVSKVKSSQIITTIVWVNGQLTPEALHKKFNSNKIQILEKCIETKFGIYVSRKSKTPFNISKHIVELKTSPSIFYNPFGKDYADELASAGQKLKLQKLISNLMSKTFNDYHNSPPWEITLIPIQIPQAACKSSTIGGLINLKPKVKSCCVLRFHYTLLNDPNVTKFLGNIFNQISTNMVPNTTNNHTEDPLKILMKQYQNFRTKFRHCLKTYLNISTNDIKSWWRFEIRKFQYNTMLEYFKIIFYYQLIANLKSLFYLPILLSKLYCSYESWTELKKLLQINILLIRSLGFIPIQLLSCFTRKLGTSKSRNGFSYFDVNGMNEICWSSSINKELVEAIKNKTGYSTEDVILNVVSMGLNQYYIDMNLPNPGNIGISIPIISSVQKSLLNSNEFKSISLKTNNKQLYGNSRNVIQSHLSANYPSWKIFGSAYMLTYISYILPRYFARQILKRLYSKHPIHLSFQNMNECSKTVNNASTIINQETSSSYPTLSVWGYPIDECTVWAAPQNNSCITITLVNYSETLRLVVLSPMKTLAGALTKQLDIYLNQFAEIVGVEKSKILYSKKSSPNSTPA